MKLQALVMGAYLLVAALAAGRSEGPLPPGQAPLTMLTDPSARCMDGTLSGYYFAPHSEAEGENKWVLHLQGGGECASKERCLSLVKTNLGSSNYFSNATWLWFLNNPSQDQNPGFYSWNHVQIPYCSQDLHTGQVTKPSDETWGLYFSGHLVFKAVLDALDQKGLKSASEIVLSGDSAGGIGVWSNLDYLAQRYPNARVVGAPIAGYYFPAYPYQGPGHTQSGMADFRPAAWPQHYKLWQSFVDQSCAAQSGAPYFCILSNFSFPFIESEVFVTEAQTDRVVIEGHDWVPEGDFSETVLAYIKEWKSNMTHALQKVQGSPKDGLFNPACYTHTGFGSGNPAINGKDFFHAIADWYNGAVVKLQDDCGIFCNPTCPPASK